jgi:hypothetical protein
MRANLEHKCDIHADVFDCPDRLVYYSSQNHQYGLIVHDGGSSYITIDYCPWCGTNLDTATNH